MPSHTPESARTDELAERARHVLPGGSTHVVRTYQPAVYVARAKGARKWLVDGRELVDYTMGHGALLFGHAHPTIVEAVREQVGRGTHYGAAHPLEVEWAELICGLMPAAQEVRFTASGTEAVMLALRVARVATGRDVVVKLDGHFHGWSDAVSLDLDDAGRQVAAPGIAAATATATRVVTPEIDAVSAALAPGDVTAVILEPSGAHYGGVPLAGDLVAGIRAACDATGTLLVLDEVVTGFRVDPGGMQAVLGVAPDLSVLGKVMAGGLPAGAVAGRRELMELLAGPIAHAGTYNANPLSASAGIAALRMATDGSAQRAAATYAGALEEGLTTALRDAGESGRVWRLASIVHMALDDPDRQAALSNAMRDEGIDLLRTSAFCSTAHGDAELDQTLDAFRRALSGARAGVPA